ncbi:MAG: Fic family protein [Candidatus Nanoarchaeia archaeon]|nr:Fic family protein [Candidatus Nanoarchaeia archaeon]
MKLPEKPKDWKNTLETDGEKVFKLLKEKKLFEKVTEYNRKYFYWEEIKYRADSPKEQEYLWAMMKFLRNEKYEKIPFQNIKAKYNSLPEINKKLHQFDKYLTGNIALQEKSLGLEKRYIISSLMEEAIASSILEGAATTRQAAKEMLKQKRKPLSESEKMVVNGFETMQMIRKRKDEKLSPEFLLEIQASITKGTLKDEKDAGRFRDKDDVVVGDHLDPEVIYHIPPKCAKVKDMINEICYFANNEEGDFIHPIIKATVLHFLIGYVHPFNDGNGRTARSVFYWYLLSKGYWLFEYMAVSRRILSSRKDYGIAYLYTEYDEMDMTYFIKYIVGCVDEALIDLLDYIKRKQKEQQEATLIIKHTKGLNFRQASILEEIMKNPTKDFTIKEIAQTYNTVYQTARSDLLYLAEKGFLSKKIVSRAFVFYFNEKNKDNINRLKAD